MLRLISDRSARRMKVAAWLCLAFGGGFVAASASAQEQVSTAPVPSGEVQCKPAASNAAGNTSQLGELQRRLREAERSGANGSRLLPLLDRLADAQELNDRFDDAERTLERSLTLRKELNSPAGETTRTMVQLGIMQRSTGKLNESISTLTECRRLAESTLGAD